MPNRRQKALKSILGLFTAHGLDVNTYQFPAARNAKIIHLVALYGTQKQMRDLIQIDRADVSVKDDYGYTALHLACRHGNRVTAFELLEGGADVDERTNAH